MRYTRHINLPLATIMLLIGLAALLIGCPDPGDPTEDPDYDQGLEDGFLEDDWYWQGYWDSYDTMDYSPIYYQGSDIPYLDSPPYDAGYWDGVWWAYNDGYFVCYRYAFIVGFSEGYDNAYWPDYLDFLASDYHTELRNGGWADGYEDGFSEGRVFGAYDYEAGLPFDWEDALADYENLTDLYFEEVDVGTGEWGPVELYEYGVDPMTLKALRPSREGKDMGPRSIRGGLGLKSDAKISDSIVRPIIPEAEDALDITPHNSARNARTLRLTTTWLQRVSSYTGAKRTGAVSPRTPR